MIEKLVLKTNQEDEPVPFEKLERMALKAWYDKTNELIDAVNEIKQYFDWDEISGEITQNSTNNVKNSHLFQGNEQKAAENCECAKNAHKSDLEEALEEFPGLFKSNKDEPLVDAIAPVSLLDIFNEMQSMYSSLWNKMEDIHNEIKGGKDE